MSTSLSDGLAIERTIDYEIARAESTGIGFVVKPPRSECTSSRYGRLARSRAGGPCCHDSLRASRARRFVAYPPVTDHAGKRSLLHPASCDNVTHHESMPSSASVWSVPGRFTVAPGGQEIQRTHRPVVQAGKRVRFREAGEEQARSLGVGLPRRRVR